MSRGVLTGSLQRNLDLEVLLGLFIQRTYDTYLYVYVWGMMEQIMGKLCHPKWMCSHLGFKALCSLIEVLAAICDL